MKKSFSKAFSFGLLATFILPSINVYGAEEIKQSNLIQSTNISNTDKTSEKTNLERINLERTNKDLLKGPFADFDRRITHIVKRIVEFLSVGKIDEKDAEFFKHKIDSIAELEAHFRADQKNSYRWQLAKLNYLLDNLENKIEDSLHDRTLAASDLSFTKYDLKSHLDNAARQQRISANEASELKQEYNRIEAYESLLLKRQGRLTYTDKLSLCIDLDHLAVKLHKLSCDRPIAIPDLTLACQKLAQALDQTSKSGKINEEQYKNLKKSIEDISSSIAKIKSSTEILDSEQLLDYAISIESIDNQLSEYLNPSPISQNLSNSLEERIAKIDKKLSLSLDEGLLTPVEVLEQLNDLTQLQNTLNSLKSMNEKDENKILELKIDIARVEASLDRLIHGPNTIWPGLTIYNVSLAHRAREGYKAKRLSQEDADSITQELKKLAEERQNYEQNSTTKTGMTAQQALGLSIKLQQLQAKLDKSLKDRDLSLPNLDALQNAINTRIGEAILSGSLSLGQGQTVNENLAEINKFKNELKQADSSLSARSTMSISFELERMICNIEEQVNNRKKRVNNLSSFDSQSLQIKDLLDQGLASGRLSEEEANLLRIKLEENLKLEKKYRAESIGITTEEAVQLISNLEKIRLEIDRKLREKSLTLSDLIALEKQAENKIRDGFSKGFLTPIQADSLRLAFENIASNFNRLRSTEGGLSYGERLAFAYGFERLTASSERLMLNHKLSLPNIERKRLEIEQMLSNLMATGRLPSQEALDLKLLLDEIHRNTSKDFSSGGGINYPENLIIVVDLARLENRIQDRLKAQKQQLPDLDTIQKSLASKIETLAKSNKITKTQLTEIKDRLDKIASDEAVYRTSDEILKFNETIKLLANLQEISNMLNDMEKNKPNSEETTKKKAVLKSSNLKTKKKQ